MAIIDLQTRLRELGRIRMGQKVVGSDGKSRPAKLSQFRLTSHSRELIVLVAELYGGEAHEWDNNGTVQYEVIIEATRLPIFVPRVPVSQFYELWSGGGCQRRCDGVTELLTDRACLCGPDPENRKCKPTTRLSVILRDVPGIGVWRLETHGYGAAAELPNVVEFLAGDGVYTPAWLSMEPRTAIRDGKTRHWMVPILEVDVTPAALLAGTVPEVAGRPAVLAVEAPSVEDASSDTEVVEGADATVVDEWLAKVEAAMSVDADDSSGLVWLWQHRPVKTLPPGAEKTFTLRAAELRVAEAQYEAEATATPPETEESKRAVDAMWMTVMAGVPDGWTTTQVEQHFTEVTGVNVAEAAVEDMRRYLDTGWPVDTVSEVVS